ncbi:MAG: rhodanese-like domain-containing protein [Chitinophagaceae bacterium]|nr:rhodanese-like domain-containing protein [Chitinophagaceae bacterium]
MRIHFLLILTLSALPFLRFSFFENAKQEFVCTPCGNDCDKYVYNKSGSCRHCNMALVDKATVKFSNYTPQQTCKKLNDPNVIVLDVRTVEEFKGATYPNFGRFKNAINIPIQELEQRMQELNAFKHKEIIVYCSHSQRSPRAAYMLGQKGFQKVGNMLGGASTWNNIGDCNKWIVK